MVTDFTPFIHWLRWFLGLFGLKRNQQLPKQITTQEIAIGQSRSGITVHWPVVARQRAGHGMVLAASGSGKSILTGFALVSEFIQSSTNKHPNSLVVIDPKGDLIKIILELFCLRAPEKLSQVTLLDPFKYGFPFNLNKLDRGANTPLDIFASQLAHLAGDVSTGTQGYMGVGMRQIDVMSNLILAALDSKHKQANVLWSLDSLVIKNGFKILAGITNSTRARQFLLSAKLNNELIASCSSRLRTAFAASESLEKIISVPNCIQLKELLSPGSIVLVDLGSPIGGLGSLQEFWANILVRTVINHLEQRPSPWTGHHVRLVIDEAQVVAKVLSETAERILTTGRSRGVSLTVLSQGTTLLKSASDTLLKVLLTNSPTKFIGRLAAHDAKLLSREQAPKLGIDESISSVRSRLVASITNLEDREFYYLAPGSRQRFRTVEVEVDKAQIAAQNMSAELEAVKSKLALPKNQPSRIALEQIKNQPTQQPCKIISLQNKTPRTSNLPRSVVPNKPPSKKDSRQLKSTKPNSRSPWG